MDDYTRKTHVKNYFENGQSEPRVLLESPTKDGDHIEYSSTLVSSSVVQYNGLIPDAVDIDIQVWHASSSIDKPINYVPSEYERISSVVRTKTSQDSLEDVVREWSDRKVDKGNYKAERARFLKSTADEHHGYCSSLLTCRCGERKVFESVSNAVGHRDTDHRGEGHDAMIWFYCGVIDEDVREKSYSIYEAARSRNSSVLQKIRRSNDGEDPINLVPIHHTPLSVALQETGAYNITEHNFIDQTSEEP